MGEIIVIELDGVPEALNVMQRKFRNHHARHKYNQKWYQAVMMAARGKVPPSPWPLVKLTVVVTLPPKRFRDYDGLVASLKPIVDGLRIACIIKDDNYKVTGPWDVTQVADKTNPDGSVRILVENRTGQNLDARDH